MRKNKHKGKYIVFTRNWWKHNPEWPNGLEPDSNARKTTIGIYETEQDARQVAIEWNKKHKPGILSRKAEFDLIR